MRDHYFRTLLLVLSSIFLYKLDILSWIKTSKKANETLPQKIHRWVFSVPNHLPTSFRELERNSLEVTLTELQQEKYLQYFKELDSQLFFGVSYGFLCETFKKMYGLKHEEKEKILKKTGYFRKINQQCCGLTLTQFIDICKETYDSQKYLGSFISFLDQIFAVSAQGLSAYTKKERTIFYRRKEIISLYSSEAAQKRKVVLSLLAENFKDPIKSLEKKLDEKGYNLSLREKIFALTVQKNYFKQLKLCCKNDSQSIDNTIQFLDNHIEFINSKYNENFKKDITHYF